MNTSLKQLSDRFEDLLNNHKVNAVQFAHILQQIAEHDFGLFFSNLTKLPDPCLGQTLSELQPPLFLEAVTRLPPKKVAQAISHLESDRATDTMQRIQKLAPERYELIFSKLHSEQQRQINQLSVYPPDEVGAYMQVEMLTATPEETLEAVKDRIAYFRQHKPAIPLIKLFVIDKERHLLATMHFADLLLYDANESIQKILEDKHPHRPLAIHDHAPIGDAVRLFETFDQVTLPVIDENGRLVGRLLYDDVYDLIRKEEERLSLKLSGITGEEESLFQAQLQRLRWIVINLMAIMVAASVVDHFQDTIQQIVALAVLMPIVAALGGNVGNQAVTITVRQLALKEISWHKAKKLIAKEVLIGLMNGLALGALVGLIAYVWFNQPMLGAVIAIATFANLTIAGLVGSLLPILFKKFKVDPAIASPLLLTTTTDALGFFIFLGLATAILLP